MPVYLMGSNPLHLNLIEGTLQAAGWRSDEIHHPPDVAALEAGLARQPQAMLVLDLGNAEDTAPPGWLAELTRRWSGLQVVLLSAQRGEALLLQARVQAWRAICPDLTIRSSLDPAKVPWCDPKALQLHY